jgi:hypothetical protein
MTNEGRAARRRKKRQPEDAQERSLRQTLVRIAVALLLVAVVAVAIAVPFYIFRDDEPPDTPPAAEVPTATPTPAPQLRLESADCTKTGDLIEVEGSVLNISGETFADVAVVALFQDSTGATLARALGLLAESFPPGESLPFVLSAEQPALFSCAVTFYLASGDKLVVDESVIP